MPFKKGGDASDYDHYYGYATSKRPLSQVGAPSEQPDERRVDYSGPAAVTVTVPGNAPTPPIPPVRTTPPTVVVPPPPPPPTLPVNAPTTPSPKLVVKDNVCFEEEENCGNSRAPEIRPLVLFFFRS